MSNDPKDTAVDLSKLRLRTQLSANILPQSNPKNIENISMITSCNEGANLIGQEFFTYNGNNEEQDSEQKK